MGSIGSSSTSNVNSIGLGKKTVIASTEPYEAYSEYGGQLAMLHENDQNYVIKYNGKEAFANVSENIIYKGELYVEGIASTGKGAGTELLARLAEKAYKDKLALTWVADQQEAMDYYSKINVKNYGKVKVHRGTDTISYEVKGKKLLEFANALRSRRKK